MSTRQVEHELLRWHLEPFVADRFGHRSVIASLQRAPARYISSYRCEIITVRLTSGEVFKLLLKDFGVSRRSKDEPSQRRERERRVYRELLAQADLGTPRYYGAIWDESRDRFWLMLELVEGTLVEHGDAEHARLAADWLARLQAGFVRDGEQLARCDFLIHHDAKFFSSKGESALNDVARISTDSVHRLTKILDRYELAVPLMVSQPLTLVHGAYIPWHILVDVTCRPARVCAVDWELAACGSLLYDLAIFTDDLEPHARELAWEAYHQAALAHRVPLPDGTTMRRMIHCFQLYRILDWLSRSVEKQFSEKKVVRLVDQAERLSARLSA